MIDETNRGHVRDSEQAACKGRDLVPSRVSGSTSTDRGWGEHVLLIGPLGTGKTIWARLQLAKIHEAHWWQRNMDAEKLYRLACIENRLREDGRAIESFRPFRAPHHSVSIEGLVGVVRKGWQIRPGELSLAHGGIFFMDEAPEFSSEAIRLVANATSRGCVTPKLGSFTLPAEFRLIATSPPCPCGFRGSERVECRCTTEQAERYLARLDPIRQFCRVLEPREWLPEVNALAREQERAREEAERLKP